MAQLLKMQQMCAEMVLKLRMAKRLAPDKGQDELMAELDALMAQVFAPEEDTGDIPTPTHEGENEDEDATDAAGCTSTARGPGAHGPLPQRLAPLPHPLAADAKRRRYLGIGHPLGVARAQKVQCATAVLALQIALVLPRFR